MAEGDRLFTIPSGLKGKKLPIRYNIDNGNVVFEEGMVGAQLKGDESPSQLTATMVIMNHRGWQAIDGDKVADSGQTIGSKYHHIWINSLPFMNDFRQKEGLLPMNEDQQELQQQQEQVYQQQPQQQPDGYTTTPMPQQQGIPQGTIPVGYNTHTPPPQHNPQYYPQTAEQRSHNPHQPPQQQQMYHPDGMMIISSQALITTQRLAIKTLSGMLEKYIPEDDKDIKVIEDLNEVCDELYQDWKIDDKAVTNGHLEES